MSTCSSGDLAGWALSLPTQITTALKLKSSCDGTVIVLPALGSLTLVVSLFCGASVPLSLGQLFGGGSYQPAKSWRAGCDSCHDCCGCALRHPSDASAITVKRKVVDGGCGGGWWGIGGGAGCCLSFFALCCECCAAPVPRFSPVFAAQRQRLNEELCDTPVGEYLP